MLRTARPALASIAFACLVAIAALAPASPAVARTALTTCSISGKEQKLGPSYVTSLKVTNTTCGAGEALVKAYYKCRKAHGGVKGHCTGRVLGYSCTEKRQTSPVQFYATVTCKSGARRVIHSYTQNT